MEQWLAKRREQGALAFDDLLAMARLTEAQLDGLGTCNDRGHNLSGELFMVRSQRVPLAILCHLEARYRRAAASPDGCPLRIPPASAQAALRGVLPPVAPTQWLRLRLFVLQQGEGPRSLLSCVVGEPGSRPLWSFVLPVSPQPSPSRPGAREAAPGAPRKTARLRAARGTFLPASGGNGGNLPGRQRILAMGGASNVS